MTSAPISIAVRDVRKSFGRKGFQALRGVSLDFEAARMHGIIGPEGSGKTTLLRVLLGLLAPAAGSVAYFEDGRAAVFEEIRPRLAYMPQTQSLYADLSIDEHLEFFRDLYGIAPADYAAKRAELLEITRLAEFVERPAGKLSGGMYKKLGLMCALLRSPRALVLDEPTTGVDPISRRELWDLLYRLLDRGILILVTTAYMDEAERCSKVHLLEAGAVVAAGEPRRLLQDAGARSFDELFLRRAAAGDP
ncbi:MAG: ABC transporter ATP-binding protein [Elusimicrobia bacterium]|nr:ABC transporter ATP-binding protein [Elusimicrobiota bacterium]